MSLVAFLGFILTALPADLAGALHASEPAVRLSAVQQVERLGAEEGADAVYLVPLAKLLADPDPQTRGLAALALSRHIGACQGRAPEGLVNPLLRALDDDNRHLVAYCGRTLAILGDRALPEITTWLQAGRPRADRLAALQACRYLVANPNARPAVAALLWRTLADADAAVRAHAFTMVKELRSDETLPPVRDRSLLAGVLRVEDPPIRTLAVLQLNALDADAFPLLADLLDDPSPLARLEVARVLERLLGRGLEPEENLMPAFLHRLDRDELAPCRVTLRRIALDQGPTGELAVTLVDATLARMIEAGPFGEVGKELKSLDRIESDAIKVLRDRLIAVDPRVQAAAAQALRRLFLRSDHPLPTPRTVTNLILALRSPDLEVAREAALALAVSFDPKNSVPAALPAALRSAFLRGDPLLRVVCRQALVGCGGQARETLLGLLRHPEPVVQYHAVLAILRLAERHRLALLEAAEGLRHLRDSPDARVRDLADRTLYALADPASARVRASAPPPADLVPSVGELLDRGNFGSRQESLQQAAKFITDGKTGATFTSVLAKLLGDSDAGTRALAAEALGEQGAADPEHLPAGLVLALAAQLEDGHAEIRAACRLALEAIGRHVVPAMRTALSPERTREQRLLVIRPLALLLALEQLRDPVSPLYWELLADQDPVVRERVSSLLGRVSPRIDFRAFLTGNGAPLETLADVLGMSEPPIRDLAVLEFRKRGASAVRTLLSLLDGDNPFARSEADDLLMRLRREFTPEQAARTLLILSRRDWSEASALRNSALSTDVETRQTVITFVQDQLARTVVQLPERHAPGDPLLGISQPLARVPAPADLIAALWSAERTERLQALQCVERLGSEGVLEPAYVPVLASLLLSTQPLDRTLATQPLDRLLAARTLERHLPALHGNVPEMVMLALLLAHGDEDANVRAAAARVWKAQRSTPWTLPDLAGYRDPRIREAAAILQVARLLNDRRSLPRALTILGAALVGPDQETRRAAALAVCFALQSNVRVPSEVLLGLRLGIRSDDASLRAACVEALAVCGPQAEDSLCTLLETGVFEVQSSAVEAIMLMIQRTKYAPRWTVPHLRSLLESQDKSLRLMVGEALRAIERTSEGDKQP
jgi:hypothetical protein